MEAGQGRALHDRSPRWGELSPKATEGLVTGSVTSRTRKVNASETDPLIRYADLSPARRGTATMRKSATPHPEPLPALRGAVAEGD
jgi:hypothetical protein